MIPYVHVLIIQIQYQLTLVMLLKIKPNLSLISYEYLLGLLRTPNFSKCILHLRIRK